MQRVDVYHLTAPSRLPLIEEEGLRTRADMTDRLGELGELDLAARGRFAHGKRVSAWLHLDHARTTVAAFGAGLVSFSVDPAKAVAAPASAREGAVKGYWETARPLSEWLDESRPPDDLEVHQPLPVRAKYVRLHAPLLTGQDLGPYAPLVEAVADEDRLSAKALMHLALIASDGDAEGPAFLAACALAWRDTPDPPDLLNELVETDPDKVASAALAELGSVAPDAVPALRQALDETRAWADENGLSHGPGLLARTRIVLEEVAERDGPGPADRD